MKQQPVVPKRFVQRRRLLHGAGYLVCCSAVALPAISASLPDPLAAFAAKTFGDAVGALGGPLVPSALVTLDAPALADNGALMPVTVSSALPGTREILLLVDGNPQPLAARFGFPEGTLPFVGTRIRMAGSGTLYVVVRTDTGLFAAACAISVTVGGCN